MRRLGIALLFGVSVALAAFCPQTSPWITLAILALVGLAVLAGVGMLWADLHETSRMVVREANEMTRQMGEKLARTVESPRSKSEANPRENNPAGRG